MLLSLVLAATNQFDGFWASEVTRSSTMDAFAPNAALSPATAVASDAMLGVSTTQPEGKVTLRPWVGSVTTPPAAPELFDCDAAGAVAEGPAPDGAEWWRTRRYPHTRQRPSPVRCRR